MRREEEEELRTILGTRIAGYRTEGRVKMCRKKGVYARATEKLKLLLLLPFAGGGEGWRSHTCTCVRMGKTVDPEREKDNQ